MINLMSVVSQYGLLKNIATNLYGTDLLHLKHTSRELQCYIASNSNVEEKLKSITLRCSGETAQLRRKLPSTDSESEEESDEEDMITRMNKKHEEHEECRDLGDLPSTANPCLDCGTPVCDASTCAVEVGSER